MLKTSRRDLFDALRAIGVMSGDVLMVHSYLPALGLMENGIAGVIDTLLEALGLEGTLVMPTFTYRFFNDDFQRGIPFGPDRIPSETGVITEDFRNRSGVLRSIGPIHPVAAFGPYASEIVGQGIRQSSFGSDSPWAKMLELGGKNLMLGTDYQNGAAFLHLIEERFGVPYRFWKDFPGTAIVLGQVRAVVYRMYVRNLDFENDFNRMRASLEARGISRWRPLGYGMLNLMNMKDTFSFGADLLKDDPLAFVKHVPGRESNSRGKYRSLA